MSTKRNRTAIIAVILAAILAIVFSSYFNLSSPAFLGILFLLVITGFIIGCRIDGNRIKEECNRTKDIIQIDIDNNTLYVSECDPSIIDFLTIKEFIVEKYDYTPEKLTYTSATVGGITTGGIHKTESKITPHAAGSGAFYIKYYYTPECIDITVNKIVLSSSLAEKASKSKVGKYLTNNCFVIVKEKEESNTAGALYNLLDSKEGSTLVMNALSVEETSRYSSHEKCQEIISWLTMPN